MVLRESEYITVKKAIDAKTKRLDMRCNHCHSDKKTVAWIHIDKWNEGVIFCFECELFSFTRVEIREGSSE